MTALCRRILAVSAVAVALLSSCSDFNSPVKDYLEEYTNSAAIGYQQFLVPVEKDADGIDSIASDQPGVIRFLLRNPRSYVISTNIVMDSGGSVNEGTDYLLTQATDLQSVTLTFTESFLRDHDRGGDISARLDLVDPSPYGRVFPSWHFNLRGNTPPPAPYASRVMLEPESEGDDYILCFNLDLRNTVHSDIDSITINGELFTVDTIQAGPTPSITFIDIDNRLSTTPPAEELRTVGNLQRFVEEPGMTQVYLRTTIAQSQAETRFTITVRDEMGLSRTAVTSTAGDMLAQPTLRNTQNQEPEDGTLDLYPDANGDYRVTLSHTDPGATLNWKIDNGPMQTALAPSTSIYSTSDCTITAWASRSGYINSDPVTVDLHCVTNIKYVNPNPAIGNDSTGNGSETKPFKTITHAVTQFDEPNDEDNTIFLMGDIAGVEDGATNGCISITPSGPLTCTIIGYDVVSEETNRTIDCDDESRGFYITEGTGNLKITLDHLTIKKGNTYTITNGKGGGIYFMSGLSGSRLTLNTCILESNKANNLSGSANGGGVYFQGETLALNTSRFEGNLAIANSNTAYGGGLRAFGIGTNAKISVDGCTFFRNGSISPLLGGGGGLYVQDAFLELAANQGVTTIHENYGNSSAAGHGGGIFLINGSGSMTSDVTIKNNSATTSDSMGTGGGIRMQGTTPTIYTFTMYGGSIQNNFAGQYQSSGNAYGGGIFASGITGSPYDLKLQDGTISGNYASGFSAPGCGGGVYAEMADISISGVMVQNNTASKSGLGQGGGIYFESSGLTMTYGTVSDNSATEATEIGSGGGIYARNTGTTQQLIKISGGKIRVNYANKSTSAITTTSPASCGGGLYIYGNIKVELTNNPEISDNFASLNGPGNGGGFYLEGDSSNNPEIHLQGGTISGNIASQDNDGQGGGFYLGPYANVSSESATVSVTGNSASTSFSKSGFGGAFFLTQKSAVMWNDGTISDNNGSRDNPNSYGEAIYIAATPSNTSTFHLKNQLGPNGIRTDDVVHLTQGAILALYKNFSLSDPDDYLTRDGGGSIRCYEYLYTNTIPIAIGGILGEQIIDTTIDYGIGAKTNYYKFVIGNGNTHCINAEGCYNQINASPSSSLFTINSILSLNSPDSTTTFVFNYNGLEEGTTTATIPTGFHVRIVPQNDIIVNPSQHSLFIVQDGGHLLVGNPDVTTTIDCNVDRSNHLIQMKSESSLILRRITIKNSTANTTTHASLVSTQSASDASIVLEDFIFSNTNTTSLSGGAPAITLYGPNSVCHFVSGGITNFRKQISPGIAFLDTGTKFYLYQGVTLSENSLDGLPSISGPGTLDNPGTIPLN